MDVNAQLCVGCGRTRDEIAAWGTLQDVQRKQIMDILPQRMRALKQEP